MSEQQPQEDRTEEPTPKRLEDARRKGDVPRSRELTMTGVMLSGAAALILLAGPLVGRIVEGFAGSFEIPRAAVFDTSFMTEALGSAIANALLGLAPLALVLVVAALGSAALLGGWSFSLQAAAFKGSRMSPLKGIKRIFSAHALNELAKACAKFALVAAFAAFWLWRSMDELLALGMAPVKTAIAAAGELWAISLLVVSTSLVLIAAVDVPFQLRSYRKKLRMTRTEVRDEFKETEGRPEVKSRIRMLQQQAATRRMMQDVPTADVVITNPTHFAVALKYDEHCPGAPRVVAKGRDMVAARIREIAEEHGVPLFAAPPLARALFHSTDIGHEVPAGLYTAVAQVLAYIFQLRNPALHGRPLARPNPEVDESLFGKGRRWQS